MWDTSGVTGRQLYGMPWLGSAAAAVAVVTAEGGQAPANHCEHLVGHPR